MKKLMILVILGLVTIIPNQSQAKEKITYAHLIDPSLEGLLYAIKNNIVKSNSVTVDAKALAIPALI